MYTINIRNKKALLFDSGRVLNGPTTGHWFIIPSFFEYVDKEAWQQLENSQLREAFSKALQYIDQQPLITTREEEYTHFLEYYNILLKCLGTLNICNESIERLAYDYVYKNDKYRFFDDVKSVIPELHRHYNLAIVSDAWPSLEHIYMNEELRDYFQSFVISSQLGTLKPDQRMYEKALTDLGVTPDEAIFIDDSLRNCEGAVALGIDAILLAREEHLYLEYKALNKIPVVSGLHELKEMLLSE